MVGRLNGRTWALIGSGAAGIALMTAVVLARGDSRSSSSTRSVPKESTTTRSAPERSTTSSMVSTTTLPSSTTTGVPPTTQPPTPTTQLRPTTTSLPPTTSGKIGPNYSYSYSGDGLVACNAEVTKLRSQGYDSNSMESCILSAGNSFYAVLGNGSINLQVITDTSAHTVTFGSNR